MNKRCTSFKHDDCCVKSKNVSAVLRCGTKVLYGQEVVTH